MKKIFYVEGRGEWSVGIPPLEAKISIEDNIGICNVEKIKKCLAEIYEGVDNVEVLTEEENDKRNKAINDAFREVE